MLHSGLTATNDVPTLPNRSSLAASPLETMPLKAIPPPSRLLHAAYYSPQPLPRTATHQWYTLLTTRYCSQGAREHVAGLDCGDRSNWTMLTVSVHHTADIPAPQRLVERSGPEHRCAVGKGGSAHMKRPASGEGDGTSDASSQEGKARGMRPTPRQGGRVQCWYVASYSPLTTR